MKNTYIFPIVLLVLMITGLTSAGGRQNPPKTPEYTLYSPTNFAANLAGCNVYLTWAKPQIPNGGTPDGLLGYAVYRDGAQIAFLNNPDGLFYFDYYLVPATYIYQITAVYDLTPYGFPGQQGESAPAGPVSIYYNCSCPLPFYEPWDQGTFTFHSWQLIPLQSHWSVNTGEGNPYPTAQFSGNPVMSDYSEIMRNDYLPGKLFTCANIYFDFDYKLTDIESGGTEKLTPRYLLDTTWVSLEDITNQGSTGWIHKSYDITAVCGRYFRIDFVASGLNSGCIENWQIDNIMVYAICKAPVNLAFSRTGNAITLTWDPPQCDSLQSVSGYNVYRSDETGAPPLQKLNSVLLTALTYTDIIPNTITNGTFRYFVTDYQKDLSNQFLCEAASDTISVDYSLDVPDKSMPDVFLYPQPAADYINIRCTCAIESCELLNMAGEKLVTVKPDKPAELTIPVTTLSPGIYLLYLHTAQGRIIRKVSVMHVTE